MGGLLLGLLLATTPEVPPAQTGDKVVVPVPPGAPGTGSAGARVTIQEFADYDCPYCRRVQPTLEKLLADYKGRIRIVYRDLPLDIHPRSTAAAVAAHCAADQGRFWEYHRALFAAPDLGEESLKGLAQSLKLDAASFASCRASKRYESVVERSVQEALRHGFYSTPTFVINGTVVVGAQAEGLFRESIDEALKVR